MPTPNDRIPKNRRRDIRFFAEKSRRVSSAVAAEKCDSLNKIEAKLDKYATDIALTVSDMFKFMSMASALLPDMEIETDTMYLKVDADGIFFGISTPAQKCHKTCCAELDDFEDDWDDWDDEEEGTLYDGD